MSIENIGIVRTTVSSSGVTSPPQFAESSIGSLHDLIVQNFIHQISIKGTYGIPNDLEIFNATGGSVTTTTDGSFMIQSGTSLGGYGTIWTKNTVIYQPGIGCEGRVSSTFTLPAPALSTQLAGFFTATDGIFFGTNGISFGTMHRYGGRFETRKLTISTAAGGAETVTINLNGTAYTTTVIAGTTATNTQQIHKDLMVNPIANASWNMDPVKNSIVFLFAGVGEKNGAYGISSTGTLNGSFTRIQAGRSPTEDWTYRGSWSNSNVDWLDPTKANLYRLEYANYGPIHYHVMNPGSLQWELVHRITNLNGITTSNFANPSLRVGWASASLGSVGTNLVMYGGSAMAGKQGNPVIGKIFSAVASRENVITEVPILTIRYRNEFSKRFNNTLAVPLFTTMATDSNRGAIFNYYFNAGVTNPEFYYVSESNSGMMYDRSATGFYGGQQIASFTLGRYQNLYVETKPFDFKLRAGDSITITCQITRGTAFGMDASFTWEELI